MGIKYNYSEIRNEMRKITAYACDNYKVNISAEERAEIDKAVAREREDLAAEQIRKARTEIKRVAAGQRLCRRRRGTDCISLLRYDREYRNAFEDPTVCYRFVDQSYCNNITGRANINITELAKESLTESIDVTDILKKYRRKCF